MFDLIFSVLLRFVCYKDYMEILIDYESVVWYICIDVVIIRNYIFFWKYVERDYNKLFFNFICFNFYFRLVCLD